MITKILILEDEQNINDMLKFYIEKAGYQVEQAVTAEKAFSQLNQEFDADILLVDWMLPGASGIEFTRKLKKHDKHKNTPIIMLTARGEENDRVQGLESGADDYVVKPFSPRELLARVQAVLRRVGHKEGSAERLICGDIQMDTASHQVQVRGDDLHLGPTEYKLLNFFMNNPERVYSRSQLLDSVWGHQVVVEERTVDVHIRRLRKTLQAFEVENYVQTVRGSGYRFSSQ